MREAWELAEPIASPLSETGAEQWRVNPLQAFAPSGVPIADVANIETDVTAIDQAAVEEAFESPGSDIVANPFRRGGFLMPFIVGFAAAWVARQWKVF
jgi:hypothetical protein